MKIAGQVELMNLLTALLIAIGLAMDAFAVSFSRGLNARKVMAREAGLMACYFGGFQAGMTLLGYLAGSGLRGFISEVDHWVAFILLSLIGAKMVNEGLRGGPGKAPASNQRPFSHSLLLTLAIATSIDALAVGVTFAFIDLELLMPLMMIGLTTFTLSYLGAYLGQEAGSRLEGRAEVAGGVILIGLGVKILVEHLGLV